MRKNSCVHHVQATAHLLIRGLVSHDKNQTSTTFSRKNIQLGVNNEFFPQQTLSVFLKRKTVVSSQPKRKVMSRAAT